MITPTISVIIPTRNRAGFLKRTIDSLLDDPFPQKEIFVCDAASSDGTLELLESYGDRIRWLSEPDSGEYDARNKGLSLCTGDIIRFYSDDIVSLPGAFEEASARFLQEPELDLLFGHGELYYSSYNVAPTKMQMTSFQDYSVSLRNMIRQETAIPPSETVFFRRRIINDIGPFRQDISNADNEFWIRALHSGCRAAVSETTFISAEMSYMWGLRHSIRMLAGNWKVARSYGSFSDVIAVACTRVLPGFIRLVGRIVLHKFGIYPSKNRILKLQREFTKKDGG